MPKSGPGIKIVAAGVLRLVEHEVRIVAPGREQPVLESGLGHPLEVDRRDDLVGVDVAAPQRQSGAGVGLELVHRRSSYSGQRSAGAQRWPATAVAAATGGETRWVRPPLPWRPSKLRFDVDAARSPGRQLIRIHPQTHGATGRPPLGTGLLEHDVQTLVLGLQPDPGRARDDEHPHPVGDLLCP